MKLFELSTNEAAGVLCEISPLVDNIVSDEKLMAAIGKSIKREGKTEIGITMEALHRLAASVPMLLGQHRADVFGVLAALNRQNVGAISAQPMIVTMQQVKDILQDKELLDFFGLSDAQGGTM